MPNSLKCKIKHLCHNGTITERDRDRLLKALEYEDVLDKVKSYVDHIRNTGMGKKKSLEFIEKFIEGLKIESEGSDADSN